MRGLKFSWIEGLFEIGTGLLFPKKADGLGARDAGRAFAVDLGLEFALGFPTGLKVLAAGLGLNSEALTLNCFAEAAEVGVRTLLEFCETDVGAAVMVSLAVLLGVLCMGTGVGTVAGIPPLYSR